MDNADDMWVDGILKELPSVPVPAALQARILADFDAPVSAWRPARRGLFDRMSDLVWPGAPLWRPATALAAALALGLMVGNYVPLGDTGGGAGSEQQTAAIALDGPPSIDTGETS